MVIITVLSLFQLCSISFQWVWWLQTLSSVWITEWALPSLPQGHSPSRSQRICTPGIMLKAGLNDENWNVRHPSAKPLITNSLWDPSRKPVPSALGHHGLCGQPGAEGPLRELQEVPISFLALLFLPSCLFPACATSPPVLLAAPIAARPRCHFLFPASSQFSASSLALAGACPQLRSCLTPHSPAWKTSITHHFIQTCFYFSIILHYMILVCSAFMRSFLSLFPLWKLNLDSLF